MPILSKDEARALAKSILDLATVPEMEVQLGGGPTGHLRFAANTVTTSGQADDLNIAITAYKGKRHATVSGNQPDADSLKRLVQQAERLAALAPEDPEYVPPLGPQDYSATAGFVPATANLSPDTRSQEASKALREAVEKKLVGAGFYINRGGFTSLANRNGLFAYDTQSEVTFTMTARTPDGRGSGYGAADSFDAVQVDTEKVAQAATEKALASREARELPPGVYPVVLEPQALGDLLSTMLFSLSARSADEGRSVFAGPGGKNRIGEMIFAPGVNLYTDPQDENVPGVAYTEGGLPSRKIVFANDGVLENLVYNRYWAQKTGKQPTGLPANLVMDGGKHTLDDLIKATDKGLLLTRFWYIRGVNPQTMLLTGLTRDGVFYIEQGKIQHAVRNFRFNESPVELLRQVEMLGPQKRVVSSEQGRFRMYLPAIKARAFHFTSLSEAV